MRILQVVTLMSADGAYGGPARVAVNQSEALVRRGHSVTIVAAGVCAESPVCGVTYRLFPPRNLVPGTGFAGLAAPAMLPWAMRNVSGFDVVHIHLARDLVTLPMASLARLCRRPFVTQTHGMVDASEHRLARPIDAVATRGALRSARAVFYLTERERSDLICVAQQNISVQKLTNGVPVLPARLQQPYVEVLFLARLHPRKRADLFADMADVILQENDSAIFTLVGPDEGEGAAIEARQRARLRWEGALDPERTAARMAEAAIYVLPSIDEPYPMSVLEAMAVGIPVIITDSCGLATSVTRVGCGIVVPAGNLQALIEAVRRLLGDEALRVAMGSRGRAAAQSEFGTDAIAEQLEQHYEAAAGE
ncbi:glycosyltransferase [Rhodococcus sp. 06-412-2C]|uniref:glycosyltransferase n=1 Tax=unclassified Rhodococcus (in: high G+C Gram-positive bacteria) TaxID=192944 RepID=UPI000B9C5E89|nr:MULTISPECIES: glycosyltransferase [unclassified Rhodococcus (in: high G+C Gram-positive bacteria)]OZC83656.1 glycosyltransferase [Rhodococcus sp. 06-412-2C]OZC93843.1 glycosyltransferase [Rhodococcus sp. 06-412-2B]